ncbi:MAG: flavin reductase [Acholeplasmatales bacterium]|nr:flavin reductase [Acholeplasmatales bacterium]
MLKKNIYDYDLNFFKEINDNFAILTAGDKTIGYNAMTVSWGGVGVLWNKMVAFLFVRHSRYTYEFIEKSDSVTLSFLSDKYKKEKALFGSKSGRDLDKFKETGLHAAYDPDYDGYYISESSYVFKGKKIHSMDIEYDKLPEDIKKKCYPNMDIHKMYIVEIKQYLVNEE